MNHKTLWTALAIIGIVVLAAFFRFYNITEYPPGLFPDEAANGEDALLILEGDTRPFYPRGNGREGLFFYLEAASIWFFGIGVWQLHIVSALIGTLTVLAMYFATKVWFGRLAGILAALFLATNHWHVTMSRTGFRAILIPLFVALFTAWVGYTIKSAKAGKIKTSLLYAVLTGAAWGAGFYTYIAYRVMIGVVLGILILLFLAALHSKIGFPHIRRYKWQTLTAILATVIVLLPLGLFFVNHPDAFVGRAGQVSIFNQELQNEYGGGTLLGTLLYSTRETIMSFFAQEGDLNWRHNVAGFPLLNPLVGLMFLLGLAWTIRGFFVVAWKIIKGVEIHLGMIYAYLLLLLCGMLTPVITTAEGMPHGLRSIGLIVPIFLLAGTAGAVVIHWGMKKFIGSLKKEAAAALWYGVIIGALVLGALYDGALYFLIAQNDAKAHYAYRADLTEVSKYINHYARQNENNSRPYLVLDEFSVQTVHFLTSVTAHEYTKGDEAHPDEEVHKWKMLDPAQSHKTDLEPGRIIIFTQSTFPDADRYKKNHPNIKLIDQRYNRFGEEIMRVYKLEKTSPDVKGTTDQEESFDLDA